MVNKSSRISYAKDFAVELAREAGTMIMKEFPKDLSLPIMVRKKADKTDVTDADTKVNSMVIGAIRSTFPGHGVLGEEESANSRKSRFQWITDPLDGTTVFSRGIPNFVFSLSLAVDGRPVVGVVLDPVLNRMFSAESGKGAFVNGNQIHVSEHRELEGSLIGISSWRKEQVKIIKLFERLRVEGAGTLDLGSIAYMGALVSCGRLTASVHPAMKPWDSAALRVIIQEAGGRVTDLYGNDQRYDGNIHGAIMSNGGHVHRDLMRLIRECNKTD